MTGMRRFRRDYVGVLLMTAAKLGQTTAFCAGDTDHYRGVAPGNCPIIGERSIDEMRGRGAVFPDARWSV